MLRDFLVYFLAPLDPVQLVMLVQSTAVLMGSWHYWFWLVIVFAFARLYVPALVVWGLNMVRPELFRGRPWHDHAGAPLISAVIASRNESTRIERTIRSLLACGYPNLEIIVVDDGSVDDSVARMRRFASSARVKICPLRQHSGKPSALNRGLSVARGEFVLILDADTEVQVGSLQHLLGPMRDPDVGAVTGVIRVNNAEQSLATWYQDAEYAVGLSIPRSWRAALNVLGIMPGGFALFRRAVFDDLGGFDTGLGDDTDVTLRARKMGWKLRFAADAVSWTNVPSTFPALYRQRRRWERNMIKIRLRKQGDLLVFADFWSNLRRLRLVPRYGWATWLVGVDTYVLRLALPWLYFSGAAFILLTEPSQIAVLLKVLYWTSLFFSLIKLLIARDVIGQPVPRRFLIIPLLPFLRLVLRIVVFAAQAQELLRINIKHGYVPDRIWQETPHW